MHVAGRNQYTAVSAGSKKLIGDFESEEEAGALRANIERADRATGKLLLQVAAGSGKRDVRRHRGENDEVDVGCADAGFGQSDLGRLPRKVRGSLPFRREKP